MVDDSTLEKEPSVSKAKQDKSGRNQGRKLRVNKDNGIFSYWFGTLNARLLISHGKDEGMILGLYFT